MHRLTLQRRRVSGWKKSEFKLFDWPPMSPDLNPIEHVWHYLKQQLAKYPTRQETLEEFWQRVEEQLELILPGLCKTLVDSMPKRIEEVIERNDGYMHY
jgi:transposase